LAVWLPSHARRISAHRGLERLSELPPQEVPARSAPWKREWLWESDARIRAQPLPTFWPTISIILTKSDAGLVAAKFVNFIDRQRLAWGCARPETLVRCSAACNERARPASRSLHRLPPGARSLDHPLAAKTILLLDRTARWRITGLRQAKVLA
jgi:hypothetical protein